MADRKPLQLGTRTTIFGKPKGDDRRLITDPGEIDALWDGATTVDEEKARYDALVALPKADQRALRKAARKARRQGN